MSSFNVNQNHPLIPREQNYLLEKKLISFHSEDRDVKQWPKSNHFQINLPESLSQVQSMRLVSISLPSNQYVFRKNYQNTKFSFSITLNGTLQNYVVEISEGTYTPEQLVIEIAKVMNTAVVENNITTLSLINQQTFFKCKYNKIKNTFWFGVLGYSLVPNMGQITSFTLHFDTKMTYKIDCNYVEVWDNPTKWGLPFYLGYGKKKYTSKETPTNNWFSPSPIGAPFGFDYEITDPSFVTGGYWLTSNKGNLYVDNSNNCTMDILGENWIYMELDKYDSIDEIKPYSTKTTKLKNNDYNGKVNSSFAKIPIKKSPFSNIFVKDRNILSNVSFYTPPLARINRLKFKFRYHDGRLVDFKCMPVSFVIECNLLRDEPAKRMNVIVPPSYMFS